MAKFDREIEVKASAAAVWAVLSDPSGWPRFIPDMDEISAPPALSTGATFSFTNDGKTGSGRIVKVEDERLIKIVTAIGDDEVSHTFEMKKDRGFFGIGADDDTKLEYTREYDVAGGFLGNMVVEGNPVDMIKLNRALDAVRDIAEGRRR